MRQRWIAWLILAAGMLICRAAFLESVVYNIDEAEYGVAARGLDHGLLPGVDFLGSNKTPGIVFLYGALFHLFGSSLIVTRVAYILMLVVEGGLLVELAIRLWGATAAIPAALLFWMVANSFDIPPDMIPLNTEGAAMLVAVLAVWLAWWRPKDIRAVLGSGAALGLSVLFRQSSVFFILPVFSVLMLAPGQRVKRSVMLATGALTVWAPVLAVYGAKHGLGWAWDSWVRYPLEYAGDTGINGFAARLAYMASEFGFQLMVPVALAIYGAVLLIRHGRKEQFVLLGSLLLGSFLALCTGSRFFGHYWVQMYPIVVLSAVSAWQCMAQGTKRTKLLLTSLALVAGLVALTHYNTWRTWDRYAPPRGISFFRLGVENDEVKLGAFAKEHTSPDEKICVWGYCPQIYWYAERLPAVRDFICHYVVGYSPGVSNLVMGQSERRLGHPRAVQMFLEDLERNRPKYIFDLTPVKRYTFAFTYYPMSSSPLVADYVLANYVPDSRIGEAEIYRRRTPADTLQPGSSDLEPAEE
ncbi:MAG TPA: glycosyltransferase family 39 protein [bacterium]|jgi:4-amino-4-deoxy-L-arabinose transferase-like glycosyltransferase